MRIVFRTAMRVNPIGSISSLNTNVMWDVRKALPVAPIGRVTDLAHDFECHRMTPCTNQWRGSKLPEMALGGLVKGTFEDGQALLGAFAQGIIAMAVIVLPCMQFIGDRHRGQHGDAD